MRYGVWARLASQQGRTILAGEFDTRREAVRRGRRLLCRGLKQQEGEATRVYAVVEVEILPDKGEAARRVLEVKP